MGRRMARAATLLVFVAAGIACRDGPRRTARGARVEFLSDERHGLERGERVRFHDFEVGRDGHGNER
jgi:hypothetical protein